MNPCDPPGVPPSQTSKQSNQLAKLIVFNPVFVILTALLFSLFFFSL